jgi:hypothetical protein
MGEPAPVRPANRSNAFSAEPSLMVMRTIYGRFAAPVFQNGMLHFENFRTYVPTDGTVVPPILFHMFILPF